ELACFQKGFLVAAGEFARWHPAIGKAQSTHHLKRRKVVSAEAGRIESNANFTPLAADQSDGGNVRRLFDRVACLSRNSPKFEVTVPLAPECQRQDRNVVNRAGLDQRRRCARWNEVQIRVQLLVQPDDAFLFVLTDKEAHNGSGNTWAGGGVDVFHAR